MKTGETPTGELVPFIDPRIMQAADGDRKAAQALLQEIMPRVRNLVRYLVRGDSEVDDMTQQALLAVLKGLHSYRGDGKWLSWVDRITAREALAYQKKKRQTQSRLEAMQEDLSELSASPLEKADYFERRALAIRLDQLPGVKLNLCRSI